MSPSRKKTKKKISTSTRPIHFTKSYSKNPDVIYIHPTKQGIGFHPDTNLGRDYGLIPVGLPAVVNVLRKNKISVRGIDHSLEVELNPAFDLKEWLSKLTGARIFLLDLHWYEHCFGAIDTARMIKQIHSDSWVILGGLSASGFSREILEFSPAVDVIVRGDAEKPLLQLVQTILSSEVNENLSTKLAQIANLSFRMDGVIVENPIGYTATTQDLDELDYLDLSFLDHHIEYGIHEFLVTDLPKARAALHSNPFRGRWLTTARGCRYECAYCGGAKSSHKLLANRMGIVPRSPEVVVDELQKMVAQGYHQAALAYDIAELGEDYWGRFFSELQRRKVRIGLYNECFQMPTREFIDTFMANCIKEFSCLTLSPLSGNERVRRLNGKHFSNEQFFEMIDLLRQHDSYLIVYFSLNLPGETNSTFAETIELAKEVFYIYPNRLLKILNSVHTIDPLSPMNVRAERYGVESSMKSFKDYYEYCQNTGEKSPASRNGTHRGFELVDASMRDLEKMADYWDMERTGKEESWWPIPPSW